MTTELAKWGNSPAVRIPRAVAARAGVAEGDRVSLEVTPNGDVVIRRARPRCALDDLVGRITTGNRHGAIDRGGPRGRESW